MAATAIGGDFFEPPEHPTGCWCCGDRTVSASLVRLGVHPEVEVCFRCVPVLAKRMRAIRRSTRRPPHGSAWRRVLYRVGWNRC